LIGVARRVARLGRFGVCLGTVSSLPCRCVSTQTAARTNGQVGRGNSTHSNASVRCAPVISKTPSRPPPISNAPCRARSSHPVADGSHSDAMHARTTRLSTPGRPR
jgi:hypothetical protein